MLSALLGQLRDVLYGRPDAERWAAVCALFEGWPTDDDVLEVGTSYAEQHLEQWPDALRVAPGRWCERFVSGQRWAPLRLARVLKLRPLHGAVGSEALCRVLNQPAMRSIAQLSLVGCELGDEGVEALARAMGVNLRSLELGQDELGVLGATSLGQAAWLPEVRALRLGSVELTGGEETLRRLSWSSGWGELASLTLYRTGLDDAGLMALAASPSLEAVRTLSLGNNDFGDLGLMALGNGALVQGLECLELPRNQFSTQGAQALASSKGLSNLKVLNLDHCAMGAGGLSALANSPHMGSLRQLSLHAALDAPAELSALADSALLDGLEGLSLDSNTLTPAAWGPVLRSPQAASLTSLSAQLCRLTTTAALRPLAQSDHLVSLETLRLRGNAFGAAGARTLAASNGFDRLKRLSLPVCALGDAGASALLEAPWLNTVEELDLSFNRLTSATLKALIGSPHLGSLKRLLLRGNPLGDAESVCRKLLKHFDRPLDVDFA